MGKSIRPAAVDQIPDSQSEQTKNQKKNRQHRNNRTTQYNRMVKISRGSGTHTDTLAGQLQEQL
jgi:hypothetical protein